MPKSKYGKLDRSSRIKIAAYNYYYTNYNNFFMSAIARGDVDILLSLRGRAISRAICRPPVIHLSIQAVRLRPGLFFPRLRLQLTLTLDRLHLFQCPYYYNISFFIYNKTLPDIELRTRKTLRYPYSPIE